MVDEDTRLVESLRSVRHFKNLGLSDLKTIILSGHSSKYRAGMVIFNEGDPCAGMFVLMRGKVHLCKIGPQGQRNIMSVIEPVIMFNEVAVLD
jgi:CRP/FNR family transcriptional regulator, dissimilatory nitrate respiration regulator